MDTVNSFAGYGKIDPAKDQEFKRKTRRRRAIIAVSSVLLLLLVGTAVGLSLSRKGRDDSASGSPRSSVAQSIKAACDVTLYPDVCFTSLSAAASNASSGSFGPVALVRLSLRVAADGISSVQGLPLQLLASVPDSTDTGLKAALEMCSELLTRALDNLNGSLALLATKGSSSASSLPGSDDIEDLRTWLSATITDQDTCLDAFKSLSGKANFKDRLQAVLANTTIFSSNSLALATNFESLLDKLGPRGRTSRTADSPASSPQNRKLLAASLDDATPSWVTSNGMRRRFLQAGDGFWQGGVNAIVAQDGTGDFTTITAALKTVPINNTSPFVIRVKAGMYLEYAKVERYMTNVFMIGDGPDKTVVSGNRSVGGKLTTYQTATFAVEGMGFMAKGIAFANTAGPKKDQAVAVRVSADQVIFYKCLFTAFQDTLYVHSLRQFYIRCDVRGTVDFIFGNAASVFQRCHISPLQPLPKQNNVITAQGKTDPNMNTGIVIDDCLVEPDSGSGVTAKTYLGRPWKIYSTTVFMRSNLSAIIDPAGWLPLENATELPSTTFYAEYKNVGPGSRTDRRVRWAGYRQALSDKDAQRFSAARFLLYNNVTTKWIAKSVVPLTRPSNN